LLIDTCGATGSVALVEDGAVVAMEHMAVRAASAELLPAIDRLIAGRELRELDAVGVVSGPGSFTGVRVGVASAKGLCEGAGVRLIAVSRLAVLADVAGFAKGVAVLDAGRGEFYVRDAEGVERLVQREAFAVEQGTDIAIAEASLVEASQIVGAKMFAIDAGSALGCVMRAWDSLRVDAALVDANYVRGEANIYASKTRRGVVV
jgi:tRNA threonylcarbamoyladenosine biosynthesis protein TsaB